MAVMMLEGDFVGVSRQATNTRQKMGIRTASTGVFLGCSGYALPPKERCKQTINLIPENEVLNILEGDDGPWPCHTSGSDDGHAGRWFQHHPLPEY